MKIAGESVRIFKIRNRKGYAAVCRNHLTEGRSPAQVCDRMEKALRRTGRRARAK